MSCARIEDLEIVAGNDQPPARWQFLESEEPDVIFDLTGSDFYLTVKWPQGSIERNTIDHSTELVVDLENAIVTWNYTVADSRLLPGGRLGTYELERRVNGTQQTWIGGRIVVQGGINAD